MKTWLIQRATAVLIALGLIFGGPVHLFVLVHLYLGLNEIVTDYIHHEVTRNLLILLLRLLLLGVAFFGV